MCVSVLKYKGGHKRVEQTLEGRIVEEKYTMEYIRDENLKETPGGKKGPAGVGQKRAEENKGRGQMREVCVKMAQ